MQTANPIPLLGGISELLKPAASWPGPGCGLQGVSGRIVLAVVESPSSKVYFDERLKLLGRSTGHQIQMEAGLGESA